MKLPIKSAMELVAEAKAKITEITVSALVVQNKDEVTIVDVREPEEYSSSNISTSINVPRGLIEFEIMKHCQEKGTETQLILYCKTGGRSALAAESLQGLGFSNVLSLAGGFTEWQKYHQ